MGLVPPGTTQAPGGGPGGGPPYATELGGLVVVVLVVLALVRGSRRKTSSVAPAFARRESSKNNCCELNCTRTIGVTIARPSRKRLNGYTWTSALENLCIHYFYVRVIWTPRRFKKTDCRWVCFPITSASVPLPESCDP